MKKLQVVLVGCGKIAQKHAHLLGKGQINGACLAAVCDQVVEKAQALAKLYHVPAYSDMHAMMAEHKDVDIVVVLTPSGLHATQVLELAVYKKHIIVEKPMALGLDDADQMIHACQANNIKLFIIKQNRFNFPVQLLKRTIDEGRFGKLIMGTVRLRWCRQQGYYDQDSWRGTLTQDGGIFFNQASHFIDLLGWMMGDVESVFAKTITALVNIQTDDAGVAVLKFRNGALGVIEATTAARPKDLEGAISILGERGVVEIGGLSVNRFKTWVFQDMNEQDRQMVQTMEDNSQDIYGLGHKIQYDHILDCIMNDKETVVDGFEGRKSLEIISALYESAKTGREIFLRDAAGKKFV